MRRRDKEDREREKQEAEDRETLKNMTEAERRAWEAAHPKVRHLMPPSRLYCCCSDSPQVGLRCLHVSSSLDALPDGSFTCGASLAGFRALQRQRQAVVLELLSVAAVRCSLLTMRVSEQTSCSSKERRQPWLPEACGVAGCRTTARGPKKSWKFLQKYWHKGAFFQDEGDAGTGAVGGDAIFRRDYSAPTGDDKMDKTVLPKVRSQRAAPCSLCATRHMWSQHVALRLAAHMAVHSAQGCLDAQNAICDFAGPALCIMCARAHSCDHAVSSSTCVLSF